MERLRMRIDPDANDPLGWGHSLANLAEMIVPCLDACGAESVAEVGAYAGDLTHLLLEWPARDDRRVIAIDPEPQPALVRLDQERSDLDLLPETSLTALARIQMPQAIVIDGDHNYYTVQEELRIIGERSPEGLPLLLFHDVAWPHARRDDYFAPELIPQDFRQPAVAGGGLLPDEPGTRHGGLPYRWAAAREGGPRNGVLTAVEDFVAGREGLRLAVVSAFFGFGAVWHEHAPYAERIAGILDPWDRNPLLERLEANRVHLLGQLHLKMAQALAAEQRNARKDEVLSTLLQSRGFALAERLSALKRSGRAAFTRADVRRALND